MVDESLLPQDRWAWVEVDLGAIRNNTRALKACTDPSTLFCAVVKANGYGHGAVQVARAARQAGADWFAVATVAEGVALRKADIAEPILILAQPPITSVETLVHYDLRPAVYDLEFLGRLSEAGLSQGKTARYHLVIDTGMDRIGVPFVQAAEFMRMADRFLGVALDGIFTHFATADRVVDWDFSMQTKRFFDAVQAVRDVGIAPGIVHCANTPTTILHREFQYNMVRAGIGLYGLHPADSTRGIIELEQAMSVRARVTRVYAPAVGEGVGYGMTYRVARPGILICTLPLGYADGLSRVYSNNLSVLFRGRRYRQVGNICMDQCMFEVDTTLPYFYMGKEQIIEVGDTVTLVGRDEGACISIEELAEKMGTINYEVACTFDLRLPKVYV